MNSIEDSFSRQFPDDVLPPECEYSSRHELVAAINAWAGPRGYAFSVKNSWKTSSGRIGVIYVCDRGTTPPRTPRRRLRETTTRYTGCTCSIIAKESICKTKWSVRHRPGSGYHEHNHQPSFGQAAHIQHRRLTSPDASRVQQLASTGIAPKDIISYLHRASPTPLLATQQDIYNCISEGKRNLAKDQSNMHALGDKLNDKGF